MKKNVMLLIKRWVTKHGQKMKNVSIHEFLIEFLCSLIIWIQARNFFVKNVFLFFSYNMSVRCFDSVDFFFKIFKSYIKIFKKQTNNLPIYRVQIIKLFDQTIRKILVAFFIYFNECFHLSIDSID